METLQKGVKSNMFYNIMADLFNESTADDTLYNRYTIYYLMSQVIL